MQKNFTIPAQRTWYEDTCITASELPSLDEVLWVFVSVICFGFMDWWDRVCLLQVNEPTLSSLASEPQPAPYMLVA